ncbi:MAG: polyamine aminopropyltransferase [Bdellovibrionales bacterium]
MSQWIEEVYKEGLSLRFGLKEKLFSRQSQFQKVEVFESTHHGRVLLNDGCFMLSERDEAIYHEMMAHVPLHVHPKAKRVLIIGGGDGGTAREVVRHPQVESCTVVEIDSVVVEASRQFLPKTACGFDHPKTKLVIGDGVEFVKTSKETFDVILVDSTDPNGAAEPLFGPEFYTDLVARLSPDGIVVAQGESVFYESTMQQSLLKIASERFTWVSPYNFTNMAYPGGLWSFMMASRQYHPLKDRRDNAFTGKTFYYNEGIHQAAFALPEFQRHTLAPWVQM